MMSPAIEHEAAPSLAPRTGADLRAARERVGWSLEEMATALRIRAEYLEALEAGRIGALPGNAYAVGFLRTYAAALGLDADQVARRFKAEAAAVNKKTPLSFPVPVPARGVPAGALALLGALLAVGLYAGWYRLSGEGMLPAETSTEVPQRLASLAEQATQVPSSAQAAAIPSAPAAPPPPAQDAVAPPAPSISPGSAAAAVAPTPTDQSRILLRATADAWVQVRDRSGAVLLTRIMHPGETWEVPERPNLLLTTGNAAGTDLVVDGVTAPSLGASGAVRRDLPLDPELIKAGKLTAANSRPNPQ